MQKENRSELFVRSVFESAEFKIERLHSDNQEIADYQVLDSKNEYLIEVKGKEETQEYKKIIQEMDQKGMGSGSTYLERKNVLSGVIKDAAEQLRITAAGRDVFQIICMAYLHDDADVLIYQTLQTIYGIKKLFAFDDDYISGKSGFKGEKLCFYYTMNDFYDIPWIDAAIIFNGPRWMLCLNQFSTRIPKFKESKLFSLFSVKYIWDLERMIKEDGALVIEGPIDRQDERNVMRYIIQHYGPIKYSPMRENVFKGRIRIPVDVVESILTNGENKNDIKGGEK